MRPGFNVEPGRVTIRADIARETDPAMATIFCMNCGTTMPEETHFCPKCGSPTLKELNLDDERSRSHARRKALTSEDAGTALAQPLMCPACGAFNAASSRYCNSCGTLLDPRADESVSRDEGMQPVVSDQDRQARILGIRQRTLAYGLAAFAAVVVLAAGGAFALGMFGKKADLTPVAEQTAESAQSEETPIEATGEVGAMGTAGTVVHAKLSDYSWSELSIVARHMSAAASREQALECAKEYHLVDEAGNIYQDTLDVSIDGVGTVPMRIVGIYHDDLASGEGKAGLTFLAADLTLTRAMKDVDDNVGGWERTPLRLWLQNELPHSFDPTLYSLIVPVDKHTNNAGQTQSTSSVTSTFDTLWIPSVVEICGPVSWDWSSDSANSSAYNAVLNAEGTQYELFSQLGVASAEGNDSLAMSGSYGAMSWWTRSSSASKGAHYRIVDEAGDPSRFAAAPEIMGVCLGFCL